MKTLKLWLIFLVFIQVATSQCNNGPCFSCNWGGSDSNSNNSPFVNSGSQITLGLQVQIQNPATVSINDLSIPLLVDGTQVASFSVTQTQANNQYQLSATFTTSAPGAHTVNPIVAFDAKTNQQVTCSQGGSKNTFYVAANCASATFLPIGSLPTATHISYASENACGLSFPNISASTYPVGQCAAFENGFGSIFVSACNSNGNFSIELFVDCACQLNPTGSDVSGIISAPVGQCFAKTNVFTCAAGVAPKCPTNCVSKYHRATCPTEALTYYCGDPLPNFKSPDTKYKYDGPNNTVAVKFKGVRPTQFAVSTSLNLKTKCPTAAKKAAFILGFSKKLAKASKLPLTRIVAVSCKQTSTTPLLAAVSFRILPSLVVTAADPFVAVSFLKAQIATPSLNGVNNLLHVFGVQIAASDNPILYEQRKTPAYDLCPTDPLSWAPHKHCPPTKSQRPTALSITVQPTGTATIYTHLTYTVKIVPLSAPSTPTPTGWVYLFRNDGKLLGQLHFPANTTHQTWVHTFPVAGTYHVVGNYYGDAIYGASTHTITEKVVAVCHNTVPKCVGKLKPICCLKSKKFTCKSPGFNQSLC